MAARVHCLIASVLVAAAIAFWVPTSSGEVRFVDSRAPAGGDGRSWTFAYQYLKDALLDATHSGGSVTEIRVGPGIQRPIGGGPYNRNAYFYLLPGLALRGGYAGRGATDPNVRDLELYKSVLSGDLYGNDGPNFDNNTENSWHVLWVEDVGADAVLDGFEITGGCAGAYTDVPFDRGAGMLCVNSAPLIVNCTFRENLATDKGGGLYLDHSDVALQSCRFIRNFASYYDGIWRRGYGGGVYSSVSSPTILVCLFDRNECGESGGGSRLAGGAPLLLSCAFHNNIAGDFGGAAAGSDVTLVDCDFVSNECWGQFSGGEAGALSLEGVSIVSGCRFTSNSCARDGGAIRSSGEKLDVSNCDFTDNYASGGSGGAISLNTSTDVQIDNCKFNLNDADEGGAIGATKGGAAPMIRNCTFLSNVADEGGGINMRFGGLVQNSVFMNNSAVGIGDYEGGGAFKGYADIRNCVFLRNVATLDGGGCILYGAFAKNSVFVGNSAERGGGSAGYGYIENCVFRGNVAQQGHELAALYTRSLDFAYNDIAGGQADVYAGEGGAIKWLAGNIDADPLFVDGTNDNYHLSPLSPCIDTGDPYWDFSLEPEPDGGRINMGAYGNTPEAETRGWLYIEQYVIAAKRRIGRTLFEYDLQLVVRNASSDDAANVIANLLAAPANVEVIDGEVAIGDVAANSTALSADTFTIRVDRGLAISPVPISWTLTLEGGTRSFSALLDLENTARWPQATAHDGVVDP